MRIFAPVQRVHARVKGAIGTAKDPEISKYPSTSLVMNNAWQALTAATRLLAWLKLLTLDSALAEAEPKILCYAILTSVRVLAGEAGEFGYRQAGLGGEQEQGVVTAACQVVRLGAASSAGFPSQRPCRPWAGHRGPGRAGAPLPADPA